MRFLFVSIFCICFSTGYSQSVNELPENYVIAWGAAPGWYAYADITGDDNSEIKDDEDNVRARGKRVDGNAYGKWIGYFPDGAVQVEGEFDAGVPVGVWRFFWENGNVRAIGKFGPGKFELGCAGSENYITAGAQQGEWHYSYKNGTTSARIHYKHSQYHGPYETYFESTNLNVQGQFQLGSKNGIWLYHYETGVVKRKEYYKYNSDCMADLGDRISYECPAGDWTYYDERGQWIRVVTYSSNGEWLSEKFPK